jgi:hypothetical protein
MERRWAFARASQLFPEEVVAREWMNGVNPIVREAFAPAEHGIRQHTNGHKKGDLPEEPRLTSNS